MNTGSLPFPPLRRGRAHEVCGPGSVFFALAQAARIGGPLLWVTESWQTERINPAGIAALIDPGRLLLAEPRDQTEALAVTEEALRSGAVPLVVTELTKPLGLTPGRRLQLAARDGNAIALSIIADRLENGGAGSNAAETRWHCAPVFDTVFDAAGSTLQRWSLIKNKSGTLEGWHVRWDAQTHRLDLVSPAGERPGPEAAPG
ncbi:ImuA family protein [Rhodovulum sulfidophilum]|uniref:ImuA family protein n=1 Tax=Rhodovulum sulfidophilum TaxID=35806 RepID=UPI001F2497C8|nr:hypothetical protein [Rhodovulum sulfidophilum]MCE8439515.1 hypothetical protein [Rhodovulum sulfidophilum]